MSQAPGLSRQLAYFLVNHAARRLSWRRAAWADPMRCEVDAIESDTAALRWAVGCVVASYSERVTTMNKAFISALVGVVAMTACVLGGFAMAGGNLMTILEALPTELMTILLGALAASWIATMAGGPGIFAAFGRSLQGRRYRKADYRDLAAALLNTLNAASPVASLTRGSPALHQDPAAQMIGDATLLMEKKQLGADQVDSVLQSRIRVVLDGQRRAVQVLKTLGRGLLWFGVVAFVLALIKTLASLTEPPEVVGGMLAHASVGPLAGIFLAVGIVWPLANRLDTAIGDDANFYEFIRAAFFCRLAGGDGMLAVRTACGALPAELALNQAELDSLANMSTGSGGR